MNHAAPRFASRSYAAAEHAALASITDRHEQSVAHELARAALFHTSIDQRTRGARSLDEDGSLWRIAAGGKNPEG
jgi:hypothetical protein